MKKLMVLVAALAMITSSAYAADWNFYGSARVATFYTNVDTGATDVTNIGENLQGNARIGAHVKVSDELTGRFEYGASGGNANIRLLYGEWNFGAGKLLVGQDYTPLYLPLSNQTYNTDNGLSGWGEPGNTRTAQIKLQFGGFQIAAVAPSITYWNGTAEVTTTTEVKMPKIEATYRLAQDNWNVGVAAGYNTFQITNGDDVDSYVAILRAGISFGALTLGGEVFAGQNVGNLVDVTVSSGAATATATTAGNGFASVAGGVVTDNDAFGYEIVAGYTINDMFALEAGVGYAKTELDNAAADDDVVAYYLQAPITLAAGVFIVPEIGKIDYKQADNEVTYYGAKWQINF